MELTRETKTRWLSMNVKSSVSKGEKLKRIKLQSSSRSSGYQAESRRRMIVENFHGHGLRLWKLYRGCNHNREKQWTVLLEEMRNRKKAKHWPRWKRDESWNRVNCDYFYEDFTADTRWSRDRDRVLILFCFLVSFLSCSVHQACRFFSIHLVNMQNTHHSGEST